MRGPFGSLICATLGKNIPKALPPSLFAEQSRALPNACGMPIAAARAETASVSPTCSRQSVYRLTRGTATGALMRRSSPMTI